MRIKRSEESAKPYQLFLTKQQFRLSTTTKMDGNNKTPFSQISHTRQIVPPLLPYKQTRQMVTALPSKQCKLMFYFHY